MGTLDFQGHRILIENMQGSTRKGKDPDGVAWSVTMTAHYGEFEGTMGTDGDPVDVFVGDQLDAPHAYVVHQKFPGTQVHDEDKVMVGYRTAKAAKAAYMSNYQTRGFFNGITRWPVGELTDYLASKRHRETKLDTPREVRLLVKSAPIAGQMGMVLKPSKKDPRKKRWQQTRAEQKPQKPQKHPLDNDIQMIGVQTTDDLATVEDALRGRPREHVVIFSKSGQQICRYTPASSKAMSRRTNTKRACAVSGPLMLQIADLEPGGVLTHNHPNDSTLSVNDIQLAGAADLASIRAVTKTGAWVAHRPKHGWPSGALRSVRRQAPKMARSLMAAHIRSMGKVPTIFGPGSEGWTSKEDRAWEGYVDQAFIRIYEAYGIRIEQIPLGDRRLDPAVRPEAVRRGPERGKPKQAAKPKPKPRPAAKPKQDLARPPAPTSGTQLGLFKGFRLLLMRMGGQLGMFSVRTHTRKVGGKTVVVKQHTRKQDARPWMTFGSGANMIRDIEAHAGQGWNPGVAALTVTDEAVDHLAASDLVRDIFIDSGAFSEVAFPDDGPPVVVRPFTEKDWDRVLDVYQRITETQRGSVHLVAPDRVGSQAETLERLERYAPQMAALARQGAEILVPLQRGSASLSEFWGQAVDALDFPADLRNRLVPAIPLKKKANDPAAVIEFVRKERPYRIHLLGMGERNNKAQGLLAALKKTHIGTMVSMDSNQITSLVGRNNGPGGGPRLITQLRDAVLRLVPDATAAEVQKWGTKAAFWRRQKDDLTQGRKDYFEKMDDHGGAMAVQMHPRLFERDYRRLVHLKRLVEGPQHQLDDSEERMQPLRELFKGVRLVIMVKGAQMGMFATTANGAQQTVKTHLRTTKKGPTLVTQHQRKGRAKKSTPAKPKKAQKQYTPELNEARALEFVRAALRTELKRSRTRLSKVTTKWIGRAEEHSDAIMRWTQHSVKSETAEQTDRLLSQFLTPEGTTVLTELHKYTHRKVADTNLQAADEAREVARMLGEPNAVELIGALLEPHKREIFETEALLRGQPFLDMLKTIMDARATKGSLRRPKLPSGANWSLYDEWRMQLHNAIEGIARANAGLLVEDFGADELGHWGAVNVNSNGIVLAGYMQACMGVKIRPLPEMKSWRPKHRDPYAVFGRYMGGLRLYNKAQRELRKASREKWPKVYRGMRLPAEQWAEIESGAQKRIEMTGMTSFTFDDMVANLYAGSQWTVKHSVDDSVPVRLEMVRNPMVDASICAWHPNKKQKLEGAKRGVEGPAFEILLATEQIEVVGVRMDGDTRVLDVTVPRAALPKALKKAEAAMGAFHIIFNQALENTPPVKMAKGQQLRVKSHLRNTKSGPTMVMQHQRQGRDKRAVQVPQRGTVTLEDRALARKIVDPAGGEAAHKQVSEALITADKSLQEWDRQVGGTRVNRTKMDAALDEILDAALDNMPDEKNGTIEHLGCLFETPAEGLANHGYDLVALAVNARRKRLHDKGDAKYLKEMGRKQHGLNIRDGAVNTGSGLYLHEPWMGFEPDKTADMVERMASQIADMRQVPQAHRDLWKRSRTRVRPLLNGAKGAFGLAGHAMMDSGIPTITLFMGSVTPDGDDIEHGVTLLHELGHVVDMVASKERSTPRRKLHEAFLDQVPAAEVKGRKHDVDDDMVRSWANKPEEWFAEAYRYAFADGGELGTSLKVRDLDIQALREHFNQVAEPALVAQGRQLIKGDQIGMFGTTSVRAHNRRTRDGISLVLSHQRRMEPRRAHLGFSRAMEDMAWYIEDESLPDGDPEFLKDLIGLKAALIDSWDGNDIHKVIEVMESRVDRTPLGLLTRDLLHSTLRMAQALKPTRKNPPRKHKTKAVIQREGHAGGCIACPDGLCANPMADPPGTVIEVGGGLSAVKWTRGEQNYMDDKGNVPGPRKMITMMQTSGYRVLRRGPMPIYDRPAVDLVGSGMTIL